MDPRHHICRARALVMYLAAISVILTAISVSNFVLGVELSDTRLLPKYGLGYKLESKEKWIIALEHFDIWKYGDNFLFVDVSNSENSTDKPWLDNINQWIPDTLLS